MNNPINRVDENGNWSLPNWAKIAIGTVALGVAIALTVATGGGALGVVSILQTVVFCTAVSADVGYLVNGEQGAFDGMCDGYMFSSISSLGSAALGYISSSANGIDAYYNLRKTNRGTGLQVHHIVEKRFADLFNIGNKNKMLGIAVSKSEHHVFTNVWRRVLPYGGEYSRFQVIKGIVRVYYKSPKLLVSAFRTLL